MNEQGNVIFTDTQKTVTIDFTDAEEYALGVWEKQSERGFLHACRYLCCSYAGETRIIFLDCGRQLDTFQNFLVTAVCVSAVGLLSVFVLLIYLSSRIVKPFSDNYEKQKRFITDAGHELKTPLTIIDADTEVLEMDFGEKEWLKDIQGQTKRLADRYLFCAKFIRYLTARVILNLGALHIDRVRRIVSKDSVEIELTFTEFEILLLLAQNVGRGFSKSRFSTLQWSG